MLNLIAQMAGDNLQFANQTNLHPVGASVLAVSLLSMLLLPRKFAVVPLLLLLAVIPSAQRITVATLDFTLIRLLILGGLARVTLRSEWVGFRLRAADYLVLGWAVVGVVTKLVREDHLIIVQEILVHVEVEDLLVRRVAQVVLEITVEQHQKMGVKHLISMLVI